MDLKWFLEHRSNLFGRSLAQFLGCLDRCQRRATPFRYPKVSPLGTKLPGIGVVTDMPFDAIRAIQPDGMQLPLRRRIWKLSPSDHSVATSLHCFKVVSTCAVAVARLRHAARRAAGSRIHCWDFMSRIGFLNGSGAKSAMSGQPFRGKPPVRFVTEGAALPIRGDEGRRSGDHRTPVGLAFKNRRIIGTGTFSDLTKREPFGSLSR